MWGKRDQAISRNGSGTAWSWVQKNTRYAVVERDRELKFQGVLRRHSGTIFQKKFFVKVTVCQVIKTERNLLSTSRERLSRSTVFQVGTVQYSRTVHCTSTWYWTLKTDRSAVFMPVQFLWDNHFTKGSLCTDITDLMPIAQANRAALSKGCSPQCYNIQGGHFMQAYPMCTLGWTGQFNSKYYY